jgi:hypothetical protein
MVDETISSGRANFLFAHAEHPACGRVGGDNSAVRNCKENSIQTALEKGPIILVF